MSGPFVAYPGDAKTLVGSALRLNSGTAGYAELSVPQVIVRPYRLTLPSAQGAAGDSLVNDGSGNLSWSTSGGITVGTIDGVAGVANGLQIVSDVLYAQSASATVPGMVNLTTQSFAGNKTIVGTLDVGSTAVRGIITAIGTAASTPVLSLDNRAAASGKKWNLYAGATAAGSFDIINDTDSVTGITIAASGAVTIPGATSFSTTANVVGNFSVATNKFNVTAASGNTTAAGTLVVTGAVTASASLGVGAATVSGTQTSITNLTSVTGTVSNSASGTAVTGVATKFLTEFRIGSTITANAETRTISAIASDTALTTDAWTGANSGVVATRAAVANVLYYPNGALQVGGTIATPVTNAVASSNYVTIVADAAASGSTAVASPTYRAYGYSGGAAGGAPTITFGKARGQEASPVVPSSADTLATVNFSGWDSAAFQTGSQINVTASETWGVAARGLNITVSTCKTGSTTRSNRLTIGNGGDLQLLQTAGDAEASVLQLNEKDTSPAAPTQDTQVKVYMKSDKFVIQFNNGGTTRYATYDLTQSATAVWATSTSAP